MTIPFVDLQRQSADLRQELIDAVTNVIDSSAYILGGDVQQFEQEFAAYCQTQHAIGVANGSEAIELTLKCLDIGPGDEVITVANTFVATALAIVGTGATPVIVDTSADDYLIDVEAIERAITPRTKAIVPVHLYGQPADMHAILNIADRHGLHVVQDAAQAHGAMIGDTPVSTMGTAACYSFYPSKNLGAAGDGGAVVTNDAQLAEKLKIYRNYGQRAKNDYAVLGGNHRLDTLQAAMLSVKLKYLDRWTAGRRAAAEEYGRCLANSGLVLPSERPDVTHVYHLYVVQTDNREELMARLQAADIQFGIHYPTPIHQIEAFRSVCRVPYPTPVSEALAGRILSLPMFPEITSDQIQQVAEAVEVHALASP